MLVEKNEDLQDRKNPEARKISESDNSYLETRAVGSPAFGEDAPLAQNRRSFLEYLFLHSSVDLDRCCDNFRDLLAVG